ncbi:MULTISPECIES: DUF1214 domain-containing protein [Mycobacterium]|uniref:DUF1254 domain-containing protein n=1 Tax=Mycobacterium kiyosense TaxID=2871094 RepID=A0A9P3Q6I6_9MYCO|nr:MULTISPECIES: DUF1214 domain-containing protein [Mycobacterium]BDB41787.1 hypothetical protein IWGMT90018_22330 [Mycobacterium kiyosense]BDE14920.1 hypothetical protein MKCMC460_37800 [Mycobacterium sp. 20KCMC460]GLB82293.1 hypothetical protein SRL2020028_15490 [Mycobacterium kiyosense]GLB89344.1 hypothetical protein SRL2020130_21610 [Mycobacterium kiyosense]GLB95997.1 hypothetical protein SRL2020226_27730 [Mycobacterium kiyosense]
MRFTAQELHARAVERRAVEAALWGMPLVNVDAMRQAYFRAGAHYNDCIFWSNPNTWMNQTTTPNHSTSYVMFFMNLAAGPIVVEVPAATEQALYGTIINVWNEPLRNVGNTGFDKGAGAKYVVLPPGFDRPVPDGHVAVPCTTYTAYCLLRIIIATQSEQDRRDGIDYLHTLKIYPLGEAGSAIQFIDVAGQPFEAVPRYDASLFASLSAMVAQEPVQDRDLALLGQLHLLGIGKDLTFDPEALGVDVLDRAAEEAHQWMMEGYASTGTPVWPHTGRRWRFLLDVPLAEGTRLTFVEPGRDLRVDVRAFAWFAMFGPVVPPPPQLYLKTYESDDGSRLNGAGSYRLRVPPDVPTTQFWAVDVYDAATGAFIRESPVVGLDSYRNDVDVNPDGSVDVYFSPAPPPDRETNWVHTRDGDPFFVLFRIYGPKKQAVDGTWVLTDIEELPHDHR